MKTITGIQILSLLTLSATGDDDLGKDEFVDNFFDSYQDSQQDNTGEEQETTDGKFEFTIDTSDSLLHDGGNAISIGRWIRRNLPTVFAMIRNGHCDEK